MTSATLDVVGIGNAIVDVITHSDDAFLAAQSMTKGAMMLVDEARAQSLYGAITPALEMSGGSAGNTIAGVASLGGKAGFIGKVKDDALGRAYRHDMLAANVTFPTKADSDGPATACCVILVTGDAQRTMNTYLGACVNLKPEDIDQDLVRSAQVTYLEGYLFDPPHAQEAFRQAARIAHEAGRKVSLSLSDSFCVQRYREPFLELVDHHIDLLFANEAELIALFEADFETSIRLLRKLCPLAAITRGAEGSVIVTESDVIRVPAAPTSSVVDTTGAGDLYAAGFLHGFTTGKSLAECGRLGSLCAAEIISHYGARPETPLRDYIAAV